MTIPKWLYTGSLVAVLVAGPGLPPKATTLAQSSPNRFLQSLIDFFGGDAEDRGRGRGGGSRPGMASIPYCLINPGQKDTLWSPQPLFVLRQGEATEAVKEIALQPAGETAAIWTAPITAAELDEFQVRYDGPPLQPGAEYEWLFYTSFLEENYLDFSIPFRVMAEGEARDRITAGLAQLQTELEATGADDSEQAIAAADYFLTNNLPADALQALFSVESPSESLLAAREDLVEAICSQQVTPPPAGLTE